MNNWFRSTPETERLLAQERAVLGVTELLSEAMERRGVSRAELANRLNVSASEVTQRLSGERNLSLRSLSDMLHVLDFGIEGRLIDNHPHSDTLPLKPRFMDWPGENFRYTTTGVPLRPVAGGLAS